ncbi:MAG: lipopolysaccharide heptosyltransferase II [Desulfobacteraceae bacterium]|jgi:3-deoxy-D-manno-octulosonic-acid transferase/heptosyltransferase-1
MTENLKSILIIKLSAIGDVVHTLPLLEVLRKNFPDARIDWLVEEEASQIIEGHEALNHLIVSQRKSWQKKLLRPGGQVSALKEIRRFLKELRSEAYDLVIDLQGLFKSGLLTGLSRGRRKIGFTFGREGSSLFLTEKPLAVNIDQHAIDRYMKAVEYLNCSKDSWKGHIPIRPSDKQPIDRHLDENGLSGKGLVAINPMARWKTKLWEPQRFAALADRIQKELSCKVVFTGSGHDRLAIDRIISYMKERPLNLAGKTGLRELAYLYSACPIAITTDTGPMHIAAAMGTSVVALFGPTAPQRTGPYGKGHQVIREDIECSPCFKKRCGHMTCMKEITVERVFESARQIMM